MKLRTVHGWDYRRYIVAALKRAPEPPAYSTRKRPKPTTASELAYTTSKISASFSNYSAWHYRSKLLPILWQEKGFQAGSADIRASIDEGALSWLVYRIVQLTDTLTEFELVKQALYTDPDDQSAWIYHRWLVGQSMSGFDRSYTLADASVRRRS